VQSRQSLACQGIARLPGQHGCERPHKIVEFELPANRDLILQLSVGTAEEAGVAITAATPL